MTDFLSFLSAVQGYIIALWMEISDNWFLSLFIVIAIVNLVLTVINLFGTKRH